ncbi:MAG: zinc ribbon domain-containing protein [Ruminococcus sp.]|nr:zinc ribbon domain-containing protein [Ruminococcus sp.]
MYQNNQTYNPFAQNVSIIKSYFKRKSVLAMAVLYCISILFTIVTIFTMNFVFPELYSNMYMNIEISAQGLEQMGENPFSSPAATSIISIISAIPSIVMTGLIALGYFIIYFKSKDENPSSSPKAGITILYILALISLILSIFASLNMLLALLVLGIVAIVGISNPSALEMSAQDASIFAGVMIFFVVFFAIFLALLLTYSISHFTYINSIKKSISGPVLYNKGAGAYSACSIILVVLVSLTVILALIGSFLMPTILEASGLNDPYIASTFEAMTPMYMLSAFAMVVSIVMYITDAVIARGYKKYIDDITSGYTNPLYTEQLSAIPAMQAVCPQCGAVAKDTDVFCGVCGATINRQ